MHPKDADGMAISVDPDQTASSEAVWSWSALFAETYLSQYIEFVRYISFCGFSVYLFQGFRFQFQTELFHTTWNIHKDHQLLLCSFLFSFFYINEILCLVDRFYFILKNTNQVPEFCL